MKKQIVTLIILAGCVALAQAKKITVSSKQRQVEYDTNMALLTAYEGQGLDLQDEMDDLTIQLKSAQRDQRAKVLNATTEQKRQALLHLKNATPEARKAAEKTSAQLHGVKNSDRVDSIFEQMSDLKKTITNNNRNINAAYKKAKNAALALGKLNGNSDTIKAFNENRQAAYVAEVQGGTLSDASSQYRHSNAMDDVQDRLEKSGHYQQKRDAKKAQKALKAADAALKKHQEKVQKQQAKAVKKAQKQAAQKATTNQKKKGKGKRAASSSNNHVVLMDQTGFHHGFDIIESNSKW